MSFPGRFPSMDVFTNDMVGYTDYVDMIPEDAIRHDQKKVPAVSFVDQHRRTGVTFRAVVFNIESNEIVDQGVFALFQRYAQSTLWVLCRSHLGPIRPNSSDQMGALNIILAANTAMDAYSYQVWSQMRECLEHGHPYVTTDFKYRVEFVKNF